MTTSVSARPAPGQARHDLLARRVRLPVAATIGDCGCAAGCTGPCCRGAASAAAVSSVSARTTSASDTSPAGTAPERR